MPCRTGGRCRYHYSDRKGWKTYGRPRWRRTPARAARRSPRRRRKRNRRPKGRRTNKRRCECSPPENTRTHRNRRTRRDRCRRRRPRWRRPARLGDRNRVGDPRRQDSAGRGVERDGDVSGLRIPGDGDGGSDPRGESEVAPDELVLERVDPGRGIGLGLKSEDDRAFPVSLEIADRPAVAGEEGRTDSAAAGAGNKIEDVDNGSLERPQRRVGGSDGEVLGVEKVERDGERLPLSDAGRADRDGGRIGRCGNSRRRKGNHGSGHRRAHPENSSQTHNFHLFRRRDTVDQLAEASTLVTEKREVRPKGGSATSRLKAGKPEVFRGPRRPLVWWRH